MKLYTWPLFCAGLLLCWVGQAESLPVTTAPKAAKPVPKADVVLCFGDSITAGYKNNRKIAYPTYLQDLVDSTKKSLVVINAGKGGENTFQGLSRFDKVLADSQPKYVIIMEGANDVVERLSPSATSFNLQNMAQKAKAAGAVPIMSTITPNSNSDFAPENYNPEIVTAAANAGFTLVDTYSRVITEWKNINTDGLHPNARGAKMIAEGFAEQVQGIKKSEEEAASSSGGGGGCFIATAAYGTALQPQVVLLKKFRDLRLLTNAPGQAFVQWYYAVSPPIADFIAQHELARLTVQIALLPLLATAWLLVEATLFQQITLLLAALTLLTSVWMRRRINSSQRP
ncbi:SGNH/GDSL hydrolase family protein [Candidatus Electronema sp. PJ]|uniref:SGNH/GDSL hydrolase family protein n=1 Tax=Candidatus Electronema sp. PJ TaxID=3401572 RepID=UPI003AA9CC08